MNERILELAKESGFTIKPFYVAEDNWQSPRFKDEKLEKFAELIVKECLYIVQLGAKNIRECDIKTDLVVVEEYNKTFKYIKEHFGVEE